MATLREAGELITEQLRERVDGLVSALQADAPDFANVARLAVAVGELADVIVDTYSDLEQTLMHALQGDSKQNGSSAEDATKEELLEQARELNVRGRSSLSKDELAQAVEAEESLTKEQLLGRARRAGIEGRSSMTKEELRKALREAGA